MFNAGGDSHRPLTYISISCSSIIQSSSCVTATLFSYNEDLGSMNLFFVASLRNVWCNLVSFNPVIIYLQWRSGQYVRGCWRTHCYVPGSSVFTTGIEPVKHPMATETIGATVDGDGAN